MPTVRRSPTAWQPASGRAVRWRRRWCSQDANADGTAVNFRDGHRLAGRRHHHPVRGQDAGRRADWELDAQQATSMIAFGAANSVNTNVGGEHPNVNQQRGANDALIDGPAGAGSHGQHGGPVQRPRHHRAAQRPQTATSTLDGGADPRREGVALGDLLIRQVVRRRVRRTAPQAARATDSERAARTALRMARETTSAAIVPRPLRSPACRPCRWPARTGCRRRWPSAGLMARDRP
jgi:hypothetical protein